MPQQQRKATAMRPVAIDPRKVMQGIHDQYAGIIAQVLQENAELTETLTAVVADRDQLRAQLDAMRDAQGVQAVTLVPASAAADGS